MRTGLLSILHRGKLVEKFSPLNFTFELLDSSLYVSEILSELEK